MKKLIWKKACIRIERQGEFGSGPDMSRTQTRLPLRPSTNMSHTTHMKHTGYQVNIIHHESHVTGNNKQYNTIHMSVSYSTPKPHGWQRDPMRNRRHLRGWVGGKLRNGGTLGAGPKVTSAELSAFEQAVRTPCRPAPYRGYDSPSRDRANSVSTRAPSLGAISQSISLQPKK